MSSTMTTNLLSVKVEDVQGGNYGGEVLEVDMDDEDTPTPDSCFDQDSKFSSTAPSIYLQKTTNTSSYCYYFIQKSAAQLVLNYYVVHFVVLVQNLDH
jgi:hypothetical protein